MPSSSTNLQLVFQRDIIHTPADMNSVLLNYTVRTVKLAEKKKKEWKETRPAYPSTKISIIKLR